MGTRYDEPTASDGYGGPHPLAGIPQEALDAARQVLREADAMGDLDEGHGDLDPIADAVVMALLPWLRPGRVFHIRHKACGTVRDFRHPRDSRWDEEVIARYCPGCDRMVEDRDEFELVGQGTSS